MTRIPDVLNKAVAFVLFKGKGSEQFSYAGTCFLVQYALSKPGRAMQYMVTARHVIAFISEQSSDGIIYIRANRVGGDITHVKSRVTDWFRHPTDPFVDVAVCQWQPHDFDDSDPSAPPRLAPMDLIPVGVDLFATSARVAEHDIGVGDDVFCVGLFSRFTGSSKNMPIIRRGSIAAMPDEPVPTSKFGNIEAFLIEVRSTGGLSGSPVFLYHVGPRLSRGAVRNHGLFYLVGLLHGHWDAPKVRESRARKLPPKARPPFEGEKLNLGIAVVIPAQKILEILDQPALSQVRSEVEQTGSSPVRSAPLG